MMQPTGPSLTCPRCNTPFAASNIEQIIDVGRDPSAKARLLNGQMNAVQCPNCAYQFSVLTPLIYHDPANEQLLVFVPMELGLQQTEQERLIGDLINNVMRNIPNEQRKAYLLQPQNVLTMQGLFEKILEADGFTPEMLEARREKARLVEMFLQTDEETLPDLAKQHEDKIDADFFQIISLLAQNALESGRPDVARAILHVRDQLLTVTPAGQALLAEAEQQEVVIQEVAEALDQLGNQATLQDFVQLVVGYTDSDEHLQALVGLQPDLFNQAFFEALDKEIAASEEDSRGELENLRQVLSELIQVINQQRQMMLQASADLLRQILSSQDVEAAVRENLHRIDDSFIAILTANIDSAEQNKDLIASARLKRVYETVMQLIQESAPPELQLVNQLLMAEDDAQLQAILETQAADLGPGLLEVMDQVIELLLTRGDQSQAQRLISLRERAETMVN